MSAGDRAIRDGTIRRPNEDKNEELEGIAKGGPGCHSLTGTILRLKRYKRLTEERRESRPSRLKCYQRGIRETRGSRKRRLIEEWKRGKDNDSRRGWVDACIDLMSLFFLLASFRLVTLVGGSGGEASELRIGQTWSKIGALQLAA